MRTDDTTLWMFRILQTAPDAISIICADATINPADPNAEDLDFTVRAHVIERTLIDAVARANALILDPAVPAAVRVALREDMFRLDDFPSPDSLGI